MSRVTYGEGVLPQVMRTTFVTAVIAALTLGLIACGNQGGPGGKGKGDRYLTEEAAVMDLEKTVLGAGALQPLEVINVGAQASGQVQLKVALGDQVRRGQLLAVIDPLVQQNALRSAEAQLIEAQASKAQNEAGLMRNELELERQRSLVDRGYTSRSNFERIEADLKVSRAQARSIDARIRQAEYNVDRAKVDLARTNITAPIDGVVAALVVREGQTVNAVQQAPTIVRLAKLDIMTVKAQISEADVLHIKPGQSAWFTVLGDPDKRYNAILRAIEPAPENAGENLTGQPNAPVYYNALFDVPNPDGQLRPAMTAQVNVIIGRAKNVLAMPSAGLGEKLPDGRYKVKVLRRDNKTADEKIVSIGLNDNSHAQVIAGLAAGDKVVVADSWDASISGMPIQDRDKQKADQKAKQKSKDKQKAKDKQKSGVTVKVGN